MKEIILCESVFTYNKSYLIFQIPRFMLISKYCVIFPVMLKQLILLSFSARFKITTS